MIKAIGFKREHPGRFDRRKESQDKVLRNTSIKERYKTGFVRKLHINIRTGEVAPQKPREEILSGESDEMLQEGQKEITKP